MLATAVAARMSPADSTVKAVVSDPPEVSVVRTSTTPERMMLPFGIGAWPEPRSVIVPMAPPSTAKSYSPMYCLGL
jgi:hypothetical protein